MSRRTLQFTLILAGSSSQSIAKDFRNTPEEAIVVADSRDLAGDVGAHRVDGPNLAIGSTREINNESSLGLSASIGNSGSGETLGF